MFNNFIGGGQVFLHKVRMFKQVAITTFLISLLIGIFGAYKVNEQKAKNLDIDAAVSYVKAKIALTLDPLLSKIAIGYEAPNINAYSNGRIYKKNILAISVIHSFRFKNAAKSATDFIKTLLMQTILISFFALALIFAFWSRFGKELKAEKREKGVNKVLSGREVNRILKSVKKASNLKIGDMFLVKDMETRHFLVSGSTGSGKTNLMHNLLPQIIKNKQPAVVIDQSGEMIAKYYNPQRGDIIFNPFDARGSNWDFWTDCKDYIDLETFAEILIGFNSRKNNNNSIDFWEAAASSIFVACAEYLKSHDRFSIEELYAMLLTKTDEEMSKLLAGTDAAKHFTQGNSKTVASIMSVLMTNIKPLRFLSDQKEKQFSLKEYFEKIKKGNNAWLFLATKPSNRNLTLPLIACLTELAMTRLLDIGIEPERRIWFVIDELPALGKLPILLPLMAEGRKYGACIIAGLQSLNQLYAIYGQYNGSSIFGQFGTSFFFRNTEANIAKMVSSICGMETVTRQQKNTSFGANEFRDGVSYSEHQQNKPLVDTEDLANLHTGECYTLLPEPMVRVSKMSLPEMKLENINPGFVEKKNLSLFVTYCSYRKNQSLEELVEDKEDDLDEELKNAEKQHELLI